MMRPYATYIALVMLLLSVSVVGATETITWFQPNFPPYVILDGQDKRFGIDNRIVQFVEEQLPDHEYVYKPSNYTRILSELEQGEHGIVTPLFRTPAREQFVHYSKIPSYLVFSNGFIYPTADKDKYISYIQKDGTIDLKALCASGKFSIAINSGRSYYGILDKLIIQHKDNPVFYTRTAIDQQGLFKMVLNKRVDAALGFPVEIKYAGYDTELSYLHVSHMVDITPVFFGTSKSDFGHRVIEKLDTLLEKKETLDHFSEYYKYWLSEELRVQYDKIRQDYYQNLLRADM